MSQKNRKVKINKRETVGRGREEKLHVFRVQTSMVVGKLLEIKKTQARKQGLSQVEYKSNETH